MTFWRSRFDSQINLLPEELLEISQDINSEYAPSASDTTPEVVLLPVDPYHLYAYWNLAENKANSVSRSHVESGLTLRIYWHPDDNRAITTTKLWFDVALAGIQQHCTVELPLDGTRYSAAIGKRNADYSFNAFVYSNTVHVPRARIALPFLQTTAPPRIKAQTAASTSHKTEPDTLGKESYDEVLTDLTIRQALDDKGVDINLAPPFNADNQIAAGGDSYNEALIAAKIDAILYAKGFDKNGAALLNPNGVIFDKSHLSSKTPSGQTNH
ncbi:MAG: DUF4912 domain-containing protein [Gammaproteobacteria bacterium]